MGEAKKLTKPQRIKLVDARTRAWAEALDDETLMGVHDVLHQIMDRRGEAKDAAFRSSAGLPPRPEKGATRG